MGPKYSAKRKLKGLRNVLSDAKTIEFPNIIDTHLTEIPVMIGKNYNENYIEIVIAAFDYFRERSTFFRSNANSATNRFSAKSFYNITLAHAIHASSNAPVNFYDSPAEVKVELANDLIKKPEHRRNWYWDGAVAGFNNPVLAGLIEAMTNHPDVSMNQYYILSVGSGQSRKAVVTDYKYADKRQTRKIFTKNRTKPFVQSETSFKFSGDIKKISGSILDDPPDTATFMAYCILDPAFANDANLVRINPCITPDYNANDLSFEYPEVYKNQTAKFDALISMDMDAVSDEEVSLITDLCDKFIVSQEGLPFVQNQLIRGEFNQENCSKHPHGYLGHASYCEAKTRWMELK